MGIETFIAAVCVSFTELVLLFVILIGGVRDVHDALKPIRYDLGVLLGRVEQLLTDLVSLNRKVDAMAADLSALKQAVADEKTVEDSAIALLTGLTQKITDLIAASGNTVDPAELQGIVDGITADKQALADAVTANTPVVPTP